MYIVDGSVQSLYQYDKYIDVMIFPYLARGGHGVGLATWPTAHYQGHRLRGERREGEGREEKGGGGENVNHHVKNHIPN